MLNVNMIVCLQLSLNLLKPYELYMLSAALISVFHTFIN
jgi:hypothetical protein